MVTIKAGKIHRGTQIQPAQGTPLETERRRYQEEQCHELSSTGNYTAALSIRPSGSLIPLKNRQLLGLCYSPMYLLGLCYVALLSVRAANTSCQISASCVMYVQQTHLAKYQLQNKPEKSRRVRRGLGAILRGQFFQCHIMHPPDAC